MRVVNHDYGSNEKSEAEKKTSESNDDEEKASIHGIWTQK